MSADENMLLIRNYDLWCHLSEDEYKELNIVHRFIEVPKGKYIYFEAYNHIELYFIKSGHIKIGYIDNDGNEKVKEIIRHWFIFWRISRLNHKRGYRYLTLKEGIQMFREDKLHSQKLEAMQF